MPHLIVEYSDNLDGALDVSALLREMHDALDGQYNISKERLKTRAIRLSDYIVGVHEREGAMIHITLRLMQGRTVEAQKSLATQLQDMARAHVKVDLLPHCAITVEVVELVTATYCP